MNPAPISIRPATATDGAAVHAINQANVPAVGALDDTDPAWFLGVAELFLVAEAGDGHGTAGTAGAADAGGVGVVGFVIVLREGVEAYRSPNYRWFDNRFDSFLYVDRVAVDERARGRGVGRLLYDAVVAHARGGGWPSICAEINTRPRNAVSLGFHAHLGFATLAEVADPRYDERRVAMVRLAVSASG